MSCSAQAKNIVGGPVPVESNNPKIIEMATWAIDEYNKEHGTCYKFFKVTKAEQQVVSGMMYYITLKVSIGSNFQMGYTKVYDQPWTNTRKLEYFSLVMNEPIPVAN